jgi:hypothetical protein
MISEVRDTVALARPLVRLRDSPAPTRAHPEKPTPTLVRRGTELRWLLLAIAAVWLAWAFPLLHDPRHYFQGDTQNAYYGWFHHFGVALLHGQWPMLDAQSGSAGNSLAEGQEGLYSPLSALIAIGAAVAPQVVVYATLVKFGIGTLGVVGCYLLARSYGVRPGLAAVAAVAVPLCGFTLSADAPRWVAGQLVTALLPWAWWATRRTVAGANPWPALVAIGTLVTTGYVFGTMYLGLVLGGILLESLVTRHWYAVRRLLLLACFSGLLAVTVYLPGVLTSPVTWRGEWDIWGHGYLQMDPNTLLLTGQPTTVISSISELDDRQLGARQIPFSYIAWFLPLVCWVRPSRFRREWTSLVSLVLPLVLTVAWTLLPYNMGPIRMPGRVMSVVSLTAILLLVVLLERSLDRPPGRWRAGASLVWVGLAAVGAALMHPDSTLLQVGAAVLVLAGVLATWWAVARGRLLPAVMVAVSVGIAIFQFTVQPDSVGGQRGSPGELSAYSDLLPGAEGDVLVVGLDADVLVAHPELGRSVLPGSLWDLTGHPVHNGYTTLGFRDYNDRFCATFVGDVCPDALPAMFEEEPTTGLRWVDLHSISTLVLVALPDAETSTPPPGWHVAGRDHLTVTWVRDQVVPTAGGVVWTSPGTQVRQIAQTDTSTSFVVDRVTGNDASVVLSRIAWPGYRVDGASAGDPLGGHLLRVDLGPEDVGSTVTVSFRPPGWNLELSCLLAALALGLGWSVLPRSRREPARGGGRESQDQPTTMV